MKKFITLLLACVMVFALAVPAMAASNTIDEVWITIDEPTPGGSEEDSCDSFAVASVYGNGQRILFQSDVIYSYADGWSVKDSDETVTVFEAGKTYQVNINAYVSSDYADDYVFNSAGVKFYINGVENLVIPTDNNKRLDVDSQEFTTPAPVTGIDGTIEAVLGEKVFDTAITNVKVDPDNSVEFKFNGWQKYSSGTSVDAAEDITDPDEVFQEGYIYIYMADVTAQKGYTLPDGFEATVNGEFCGSASDGTIKVEAFLTPVEAPAEEPSPTPTPTATPTATPAPTEEPTDTPKTGDTVNMWLYVFVGVLALGAMGTVILKKKADR